jgi:outer membrane lipoprotein SlyB
MARPLIFALALASAAVAVGCGPQYSPNTYASSAVQQANKVDRGVIIGVRMVQVSAPGVVGAASGAAAGGIVGAQTPGGSVGSAFGAIGGGLLGGLVGTGVEHVASDTAAYEYIVRKPNGDLISVTQKDTTPLPVGTKVLVIAGNQARIVPDYTVALDAPQPAQAAGTAPTGPATAPTAGPATGPATGPTAEATAPVVPPSTPITATPLPPPPPAPNPATTLP